MAIAKNKRIFTTHGRLPRKLYITWKGMRARCNSPGNSDYSDYGGRGIKVCDEWEKDFTVFRDWALDNGYSPSLTIERIENNAGYNPTNCRWATRREQLQNRRNTVFVTVRGVKKTLVEVCREYGISSSTARRKLRMGKDAEQIFILRGAA